MLHLLKKIFGTQQTRLVKRYFRIVKKINEKAEELKNLSNTKKDGKPVKQPTLFL
jgi:preprotein translocase subunit SecA